jgi:chemotaxis-related protein WspD
VAVQVEACWNEIGMQGDASCGKLQEVVHCRNCPVYSTAGVRLLDRPLLPEYRRAWTEHFAQQKAPVAPAKQSVLLFRLKAEWLALPAQVFQEVAEQRVVHSLPHRRQGIVLGLVNVRGELAMCVSLGRLLGLEQTLFGEAPGPTYDRLLVASWDGDRFVFPADEVRGIHRFQTADLTEPPATLAKSRLSYTQGILQWQGRSVGLLDADLVFSALNRSLL